MTPFKMPPECVAIDEALPPHIIDDCGHWLIAGDAHFPFQDNRAIELALREAQRLKVRGILLNGDMLDCAQISRHLQYRATPILKHEIEQLLAFLRAVRKAFPRAKIIYKRGNHEERLNAYITTHAPALEGLEGADFPSLLHFKELGVEWVSEKRTIKLGKLNVHHGHEFNGGGGTNVARWLLTKCGGGTADCCNHFHRTDAAGGRNINDFLSAAWGIGCLCGLKPFWFKNNQWNHGFATVELSKGGSFQFNNRRIINGKVYA